MFLVKRVYDAPGESDGLRILVDRMWPRGLSKERAAVDLWLKELAPSDALRKWFGHDPERWPQFKQKYHGELARNTGQLAELIAHGRQGQVTLLYAAKDTDHNNAVALSEYLAANAPAVAAAGRSRVASHRR